MEGCNWVLKKGINKGKRCNRKKKLRCRCIFHLYTIKNKSIRSRRIINITEPVLKPNIQAIPNKQNKKCPHNKYKNMCKICYDCGHGRLEFNCKICSSCKHTKLINDCLSCREQQKQMKQRKPQNKIQNNEMKVVVEEEVEVDINIPLYENETDEDNCDIIRYIDLNLPIV